MSQLGRVRVGVMHKIGHRALGRVGVRHKIRIVHLSHLKYSLSANAGE